MKDLFVENSDSAEMQDERWKIAFFEDITHGQIVKLANLANFLNVPQLLDSCLEVIALQMRVTVDKAEKNDKASVTVNKEQDEQLRQRFSWAYNQSYQDVINANF